MEILNFTSGTDKVSAAIVDTDFATHATSMSVATAADILADAFGTSFDSGLLVTANNSVNATALFTYNGQDTYLILGSSDQTSQTDASFGNGELIIKFVDTDTIVGTDITTA